MSAESQPEVGMVSLFKRTTNSPAAAATPALQAPANPRAVSLRMTRTRSLYRVSSAWVVSVEPSSTTTSCRSTPSSGSARSASRHSRVIVALLCTGMTIDAVGLRRSTAGACGVSSAVVIVKENVRTTVSGPLRYGKPIAILVGHQCRVVGDGLELVGELRAAKGPVDVTRHRRNAGFVARAVFSGTEVFDHRVCGKCIAVREPRRHPDPLGVILVALDRHVVCNVPAVRWRSFADVEYDVDHVTANGTHEFAHVRVPLEVQPANRSNAGEALIGLNEADAAHEGQCVAGFEIAEAILFAEVAPVVRKPRESNDIHFGNGQFEHVQDLHTLLPITGSQRLLSDDLRLAPRFTV